MTQREDLNDLLGPILDPNLLIKRKFRWVAVLYKDGDKVTMAEFVRVSRRPPLTISATATESWNEGGEMALTFQRTNIEECDEIWLGLIGSHSEVIEEWEMREVKKLPQRLFTSHIPGDVEYEDNPGEETLKFRFGNMSYRYNVPMKPDDKDVGKWTNYSSL